MPYNEYFGGITRRLDVSLPGRATDTATATDAGSVTININAQVGATDTATATDAGSVTKNSNAFVGATEALTAADSGVTDVVIALQPAVSSSLLATGKVQEATGLDRWVEGYSGSTIRLKRLNDNAEQNFGFNAAGYFDWAGVETWRGTANVDLVYFISQITGNPVLNGQAGCAFIRNNLPYRIGTDIATDWSLVDGQITLPQNKGAGGVLLNGTSNYLETAASGLNASANGIEGHILFCPQKRKRPSGTDFTTFDTAQEQLFTLGATNNTYYWGFKVNGGTSAFWNQRKSTAGTESLSSGMSAGVLKKNASYVMSARWNGANGNIYESATTPASKTNFSATAQSEASNLNNATFRVGRSTDSASFAYWGNFIFAGLVVTTGTLTADERNNLHARMNQISQQNHIISKQALIDMFDEIVDWRDVNASTGQIVGKKGKMTFNVNKNTGSPNWDFAYTVPNLGYSGLRSIGSNNDNVGEATTAYFNNVHSGTMVALHAPESSDLYTVLFDASTKSAIDFTKGLGRDHGEPRLLLRVDPSLDPQSASDSYGFTDFCELSQPHTKYGYKLALGSWTAPKTTGVAATLIAFYGSVLIPQGSLLTTDTPNATNTPFVIDTVDTTNDVVTSAALQTAFPNITNGQCYNLLVQVSSTGSNPGGLAAATDLWARINTNGQISFHNTYAAANGNTGKIDITSAGSGTISLVVKYIFGVFQLTNGAARPGTPENNNWRSSAGSFSYSGNGKVELLIGTFERGAGYNEADPQATREQYMRTGTNWLYGSALVAMPIGHRDFSVARQLGWGPVTHSLGTRPLRMGYHQAAGPFQGTYLWWGFMTTPATQTQAQQIAVNLYKLFEQGYS